MTALRRLLRSIAIDTGPLRRHREFRLLFAGQAVSLTGSMLTYVAVPFQVYDVTRSTLLVGLIGLAEIVPLLFTALLGGALADAHDRRRLVLIADATMLVFALVLLGNALLADPHVWLLFVAAAGMAGAGGLQRPPLDAMLPRLVPREDLAAASALDGFRGNAAQIAGPALAGVLIATIGLSATYAIDAATFLVSLVFLARMRAVPPPPEAAPASVERIREGWRYARSRQELVGSYAVDINAMLFGIPVALFPAVADRYGGPQVLGLLYAAEPVGGDAVHAGQRMGRARPAPRQGDRAERGRVRRRDRRLRLRRIARGRARRPGRRRRGGHGLGDLPADAVEPDDPRPHARPARRDRAALLLDRPDARHRPVGRGGGGDERPLLDRLGRRRSAWPAPSSSARSCPRFWRYRAEAQVSA